MKLIWVLKEGVHTVSFKLSEAACNKKWNEFEKVLSFPIFLIIFFI